MPNVSIMIAAQDNYSDTIKKISSVTKAFDKDLENAQRKLNVINNSKATFKVDVDKANRELKTAQKAFDQTGDAADKLKLIDKQLMFDNATRNMGALKKAAAEAEKEITKLSSTTSKAENRAEASPGKSTKSIGIDRLKGFMGLASSAGIMQMATDTGQAAFNFTVGSALGSEEGNVASKTVNGGINGMTLGYTLGGPIGAAVGGVLGAGVGALNGGIENAQKRDDNFKGVVQDRYQMTQQTQADTLTSGSDIAASRETSLQSFTTMFKDADVAKGFMDEMKDFANVTPFLFDDLTGMAKTLKTYNYDISELKPMMQKIGDAGAAKGMGQADMSMIATGLGRMRSSGKTSLEYLNLLIERGVPAIDYLSKGLGKSNGQIYSMVSKGLIPGAKAAQIISDSMGEEFAGSMEAQAKTYPGMLSTLQGMNDEMANAMGEAYNEERKKGMANEIAFKQGDGGAQMMLANSLMGQFKGSLENMKAQIQMDMQGAIMNGVSVEQYGPEIQVRLAEMSAKYKELAASGKTEDGAAMGALLAEAQVMAENEYMASEGAQLEKESQLGLIKAIRNDTRIKDNYYNTGIDFGIEFSKGMAAAVNINISGLLDPVLDSNDPYQKYIVNAPAYHEEGGKLGQSPLADTRQYMGSHAYGLTRVPYDNYPALLHEGERVLTAAEARNSKSSSVNVNIGGTFYVREETDIDKIANSLAIKLKQAQAVS